MLIKDPMIQGSLKYCLLIIPKLPKVLGTQLENSKTLRPQPQSHILVQPRRRHFSKSPGMRSLPCTGEAS